MSTARYRLLSPGGQTREDGEAEVEVRDGMLMLAPAGESVLPIPFGRIMSVTEPEPFTVRLTLAGGDVIELGRLGVMRTQLLAELRDGRADAAAAAAAAVGEAEAFGAFVAGRAGEVRVYDDALLVIAADRSERVSFSFAGAVRVQDYAVTVEVTGREPVVLTRLGRRTSELAELLTTRIREASVRTAAFLAALLPGLDPIAVRAAAGLLRDGVAVPAGALDGVQPGLAGTLIQIATRPDRRDAVAELGRAGGLAVGFRQLASVRPEPATYVFRGDPAAVNRALDDAGFDPAALAASPGPARPAGSRTTRSGPAGSPRCSAEEFLHQREKGRGVLEQEAVTRVRVQDQSCAADAAGQHDGVLDRVEHVLRTVGHQRRRGDAAVQVPHPLVAGDPVERGGELGAGHRRGGGVEALVLEDGLEVGQPGGPLVRREEQADHRVEVRAAELAEDRLRDGPRPPVPRLAARQDQRRPDPAGTPPAPGRSCRPSTSRAAPGGAAGAW